MKRSAAFLLVAAVSGAAAAGSVPEETFSRPGVVARRGGAGDAAWRVEVEAVPTGLGVGAIVEFPLITLNSGHEYEALFRTPARAADVRAAMAFAGLRPGAPASAADFRFWPRGERVLATVLPADGAAGEGRALARFLADESTGGPVPGGDLFVYSGGGDFDVDSVGPGSIVSTYNEPATLFDVPRLAAQGDVYGSVVAAESVPTNGMPSVRIVFGPEPREAAWPALRVRDVALRLSPEGLSVDGAAPLSPSGAAKALSAFRRDGGQDAFVSFSWDAAVPLRDVAAAARLLSALEEAESSTGVRIDAPPPGFPFCKAFLPRDEWRDRAKRFSQPCELRFPGGGAAPSLVRVDEKWDGESLEPELSTEEIPLSSPDALPALLKANSPEGLRALLVFAPSDAAWGELAPWLDAARPTHPVVQIFLD